MGNSDESERGGGRLESGLLGEGSLGGDPVDGDPVEGDAFDVFDGDLETQLLSLYGDRERLHRELGTADPDAIVGMVRSLEAQLVELYRDKERDFAHGGRDPADGRS